LVTGAGGFIGSHLTEALLSRGHSVRALAHYNGAGRFGHLEQLDPSQAAGKLELLLGDVTDASMMRSLVEGCDAVLHLAALIGIPYSYAAPSSYVATNVLGTLNLLPGLVAARIARRRLAAHGGVREGPSGRVQGGAPRRVVQAWPTSNSSV
jgi:nucleoside-diphosphate-sugar epimerase